MGVQTSAKMMKLISTLALVAAASAQYAPAPVVVAKEIPQPYAYEYGVADDYSKANFRKTETQDAAGNVGGSFTIALPDGRIQTTTYTADHTNGFVAEVTYSARLSTHPHLLEDTRVRLTPPPPPDTLPAGNRFLSCDFGGNRVMPTPSTRTIL